MLTTTQSKVKVVKNKQRQKRAEEERRIDISMLRLLVEKRPKEAREIVREIECFLV